MYTGIARNAPVNDTKNTVPFVIGVVVVGGIAQVQPKLSTANLLIKCYFCVSLGSCATNRFKLEYFKRRRRLQQYTEPDRKLSSISAGKWPYAHTIRCVQWLYSGNSCIECRLLPYPKIAPFTLFCLEVCAVSFRVIFNVSLLFVAFV